MKVENPEDRQEAPEECDNCSASADLKRFSHYGPGYQVEWLCCYCCRSFDKSSSILRSVSQMLHHFEKRLGAQNSIREGKL